MTDHSLFVVLFEADYEASDPYNGSLAAAIVEAKTSREAVDQALDTFRNPKPWKPIGVTNNVMAFGNKYGPDLRWVNKIDIETITSVKHKIGLTGSLKAEAIR